MFIFFSPKLIHAIAEATAKEVRAKYNYFTKEGQYGDHKGLSCFSPVINIMRHPLWGRNQVRPSFFIFCFADFFRNKLVSDDEIKIKIKFIRTIFRLN